MVTLTFLCHHQVKIELVICSDSFKDSLKSLFFITCVRLSAVLPSCVCALSWTPPAELLEGGAEEGRAPPPAGPAGVGMGGLAATAGLGGRGPTGRSGTAGFG